LIALYNILDINNKKYIENQHKLVNELGPFKNNLLLD